MPEQRLFAGWSRPALHCAVEVLADRYAAGDELCLRPCTLVVPGARAGRRLKELLVEESTRRGLRLVPPAVITAGHLPEQLYEAAPALADPALCRRAWCAALRQLPGERFAVLFSERPAAGDLRQWLLLAAQLEQLHAEVSAGGLTFRELAGRCGDRLLFDDRDRWSVLAALQEAYAARLLEWQRADRDLSRIAAVRHARIAFGGDLWLVGLAELPQLVRSMLAELPPERVSAIVHAPRELADAFDALGCVDAAVWGGRSIPLRDEQLVVAGTPARQAAAAVEVLAALPAGHAPDDIVIGVPDPEVVSALEEQLESAGAPARYAAGTPLHRSAPYRLLEAVAAVLDGGATDDWAALARHPDLARIFEAHAGSFDHRGAHALREVDGWLAPLDGWIAEHLPARLDGHLPGSGHAGRAAVDALLRLLRGPAFLGPLRGQRRTVGEWMPAVLDVLLATYGTAPLDRGRPGERHLLAACSQLRDAAAQLHRLPAAADESCDAATAVRILLDDARGGTVPDEPGSAAVELLGWLELHLDDSPVAIVTGANEPRLPDSLSADAFLPDSLRTAAGLVDNERRYARDAYQLTAMLHSRTHVTVIAGRRSGTGDPLRPSRLLLAVDPGDLARRVVLFYRGMHLPGTAAGPVPGSGSGQGAVRSSSRGATADVRAVDGAAAGTPAAFVLPPDPVIAAPEPVGHIAVTAFRALLQDPYLFALERVLRLRETDDRGWELDPLAFGVLAHAVLQRFSATDEVGSTDAHRVAGRLAALLGEEADARFGRVPRPAVRLQLQQLRARLDAFARWHAAWIADGWHVVASECSTEEGAPFVVDGMPIRVTGRIDRIDRNARTGRWAVFDYKTSEKGVPPEDAHRTGRGDSGRWIDLQLPMYRHLLPHVVDGAGQRIFTGSLADVQLGYITLCADADAVRGHLAEWSEADYEDADRVAADCIRLLRENAFRHVPATTGGFLGADLKALLGQGRLTAADEEDS